MLNMMNDTRQKFLLNEFRNINLEISQIIEFIKVKELTVLIRSKTTLQMCCSWAFISAVNFSSVVSCLKIKIIE